MFVRQKKEAFLSLNSRATDDITRVTINQISSTTSTATLLSSSINISQEKEITLSTENGTFKKECLDGLQDIFCSEK